MYVALSIPVTGGGSAFPAGTDGLPDIQETGGRDR
jgi:hypothetical protein